MTGTYGIGRDSTTAVSDFISGFMGLRLSGLNT